MKNKVKICKSCGITIKTLTTFRKCISCRRKEAKEKKDRIEVKKLERKLNSKWYQEKRKKTLKNNLWTLVSRYVRRVNADSNGMAKCYTCGKILHYKDLECGHFHHNRLDFDLRNLKPQCFQCNRPKHGNHSVYGTYLVQELGVEGMNQLLLDANTKGNNYSILELESLTEYFTEKNRELEITNQP